ncbi:3-oxoacyl-[acyl-carrier-protein] synthase III C-terminal domain-containing protein [Parabacteroides distasonis]|nr:3-oxoacyl-[acyl-carrier-protein] synthase III C-terminal domain-containing protein [Parabacteroides distasonis]WRY44844.1 3-oxoacyl-[acyl-carrier-protein] synthase III C-terminal domain-containing protein [Parabacteroides distasonis]
MIHPANKMIVDRIVKKLKLSKEKVPYNLEEFGNDVGEDETDGCSTISSIKVII